MSRELPWVKVQPVIRYLNLIPVNDLLLEDTITVAQTVAPSRVVQACEAVEKAGGEAAQAAISQSGVVLLFNDVLDPETKFGKASYESSISSQIRGIVRLRDPTLRDIPLADV